MKKLFFVLAASAALFSCGQNDQPKVAAETNVAAAENIDMDGAKKAVTAANEKLGNAMAAGDSVAITSLYHSEAKLFPPNGAMWDNRSAMGSMAAGMPEMGIKKVSLETAELLNGGEYVIERGAYEMSGDTKTIDKGKYIVIWKQEGGEWKLFRDIWNSDNPPPPAAR